MTPIFSVCIWSPKLFKSQLASPTCGHIVHFALMIQIMLDTVEQQAELVPRFFFQSMKTPANYTTTTTECKIVDKRGVKNAIKIVSVGFFLVQQSKIYKTKKNK